MPNHFSQNTPEVYVILFLLLPGQNQRTFEIGLLPRKILEDSEGKKIRDISRPLKNRQAPIRKYFTVGRLVWYQYIRYLLF